MVDRSGNPVLVLDADHLIRDAIFAQTPLDPQAYCHRPIVVTDMNTRLGNVLGRLRVTPERPGDDVIDEDLILVWGETKRVITGGDLLGRLLRGVATVEKAPIPHGAADGTGREHSVPHT